MEKKVQDHKAQVQMVKNERIQKGTGEGDDPGANSCFASYWICVALNQPQFPQLWNEDVAASNAGLSLRLEEKKKSET